MGDPGMNTLNGSFQFFHHAQLALALAVFPIKAEVFWPYFTCAILSIIGLTKVIKDDLPQKHGLDKFSPFGRLFYAIPMGVFGTEHFTITQQVAGIVPSWMPLHIFWVYLVGTAVIAASLSIILDKHVRLAATLFGCMLLLFVALIHIPNLVATHSARLFWVICLRDIAFSGGAFALAATHVKRTPPKLLTLCRFLVGIPAIVIGVDHFLYPKFNPGIPMEAATPAWIPLHLFWTYLAGAALITCGASILVNKKARMAATSLTIVVLLIGAFVYIPIIVANPSDIDSGLGNLVDIFALSGTALILADAITKRTTAVTG
jgi:uncharacterized membrane protein